jgi:hypothetical protein
MAEIIQLSPPKVLGGWLATGMVVSTEDQLVEAKIRLGAGRCCPR